MSAVEALIDITITMEYLRSTKGTHVYIDGSEDSPCKTIYIKRGALPTEPPATITVTIGD